MFRCQNTPVKIPHQCITRPLPLLSTFFLSMMFTPLRLTLPEKYFWLRQRVEVLKLETFLLPRDEQWACARWWCSCCSNFWRLADWTPHVKCDSPAYEWMHGSVFVSGTFVVHWRDPQFSLNGYDVLPSSKGQVRFMATVPAFLCEQIAEAPMQWTVHFQNHRRAKLVRILPLQLAAWLVLCQYKIFECESSVLQITLEYF